MTISGVSANPSSFSPCFNQTTTISYTLSEPALNNVVTIKIYDSDFNLVRTVPDADGNSGPNSWVWDGKDDNGNILEPDKYIFVIEAKDTGEFRCEKAHRNKPALEKGGKIAVPLYIESYSPSYLIFNPDSETLPTISFVIKDNPKRKPVKTDIKIYDAKHNLVRTYTIDDTPINQQTQQVWDGKDNGGRMVRGGIYPYNIDATDKDGYNDYKNSKTLTITDTKIDSIDYSEISGKYMAKVAYLLTEIRTDEQGNPVPASEAKVEAYDPDLIKVAGPVSGGTVTNLPGATSPTWNYVDVELSMDKPGAYRFLVSAKDAKAPQEAFHHIRPALEHNVEHPMYFVGIDPGHGGAGGGGTHGCWYEGPGVPPGQENVNRYAWDEKEANLEAAFALRGRLYWHNQHNIHYGYCVCLSRETDKHLLDEDRLDWARDLTDPEIGAKMIISLHCNGIGNSAEITDNFVAWREDDPDIPKYDQDLATCLHNQLTQLTGITYNPIEQHDYWILDVQTSAALVEMVTLTNPGNEDWIDWHTNRTNLENLADKIHLGMDGFINLHPD